MDRYTKGPWEARGKRVSSGKDCVGGESICECYDNGMANARLIAAAPELIMAMKEAIHQLEQTNLGLISQPAKAKRPDIAGGSPGTL